MTAYPCGIRTATRRTFLSVLGAVVAVPFVRWRQAPAGDEAGDIDALKASVNGTLHTNEVSGTYDLEPGTWIEYRDTSESWLLQEMRSGWRSRCEGLIQPDHVRLGEAAYSAYEDQVYAPMDPSARWMVRGKDGNLYMGFKGKPVILDDDLPDWSYAIRGGWNAAKGAEYTA
jgi:hypothetical protein